MIRDPFYNQIIERLQGKLDPDLFEACAADLLRTAFPTLVPVRGGTDAGMDGAVADGQGEPFPLVTTTSKNVIGNLTRNLTSYLEHGGTRRKVIVATSQELTPKRQRNLYKRATELEFSLISIHEQATMANLLYRSPEWCKELLNLTGDPCPLSVVPRTIRPQLLQSLIGRYKELDWLKEHTQDGLLIGQPGSGKTSLLRELTTHNAALFVISENRGEIAAAIRKQEPEILIVDDAHIHQKVILNLLQLRKEMSASYSILASSWPSFQANIAEMLNLTQSNVLRLELLPRDEIVNIVKAAGVYGPNELIKEIIDQAQGRPGLAVTLAYLCLRGGIRELLSGEALKRSMQRILNDLAIKQNVIPILGAFSLGGQAGMSLQNVAEVLHIRETEVWEILTQLEESGIISEGSQQHISVQPPTLRYVLIRDVFFNKVISLPIQPLLSRIPDLEQHILTLIGTKAFGGEVPEHLMTERLPFIRTDHVWREYAWLGDREVNWILTSYPDKISAIATPALQHLPERAIPMLLEKAKGDVRPLHANPDHPFRLIGDWIQAARPHTPHVLARRKALLRAIQSWLNSENDIEVGIHAMQYVMSPGFEYSQADPGSPLKGTFHYGLLRSDEISVIADMWKTVLAELKKLHIADWEPIQNIVDCWLFPARIARNIPDELYEQMQTHAAHMLRDVVELADARLGIRAWAMQMVEHATVDIDFSLDEDFMALYPSREPENWQEAQKQQAIAIKKLAKTWSTCVPQKVVERILFLEDEAKIAQLRSYNWLSFLCSEIAKHLKTTIPWIETLIQTRASGELIAPFLYEALRTNKPEWIKFALICLERSDRKNFVITLTLTLSDPPAKLLERVLQELDGCAQLIESICFQNTIPEQTMEKLLLHEDTSIARAAAEGEWRSEPQGCVRGNLRESWCSAVLDQAFNDDWLDEVFETDPILAYNWLEVCMFKKRKATDFTIHSDYNIRAAIKVLDTNARRCLLEMVPLNHRHTDVLITCLVGEDLDLYQYLLSSRPHNRRFLSPLLGWPKNSVIEKIRLALDAGYVEEEVKEALYGRHFSWEGNESDMWARWLNKLEMLSSHEDERIKRIGIMGCRRAKEEQERALKLEKERAIYGRW